MGSSRRQFVSQLALAGAALVARPSLANGLPSPPAGVSAGDLASDETFWREVGRFYDRTEGILNLEHGYWGKMAHPVQAAYVDALDRVNRQNSYFGRKAWYDEADKARARVARALGAETDEIVITRNATEAIHNLVRQYRGLAPGDAVLLADIDYPGFKPLMRWLAESRGVEVVELALPSRIDRVGLWARYLQAFDAHPRLKLMLITHASNQHGLVLPVAEIAAEARRRNIDVICDAAQSWGLLDYGIGDLGVDYAGFNLHKWIGAPLGVGALYLRRGSLVGIAPYPGEQDTDNTRPGTRIHSGTINFAATLAIPPALDVHETIGPANKEARLRYLRDLWTTEADALDHIEVLGGSDEAAWSGIASFRQVGRNRLEDAQALQKRLENDFGIFTVVRKGLASGACVRITPQVYTTPDEIGQLVEALRRL